ncbi:WXG100 family type VII secretion target [Actinocatenispora comari]|uniref:WXG100 family type VII secretion target n=1 Tax=Actinocatenispora comari TaxID=2807577 RepID=A0A8J4ENK7_9ACTN|nr:hypothetical protein [Actinocatenispora comari]GIL31582.1 hypothetical protein NUM_68360 [Actinocatenispora comari]
MGGNLAGDPGDMSWEDIVEASCVNGSPSTLTAAADRWKGVFRNADSVKEELDTLIKDLKDWKGSAGDTYRKNIKTISDQIHQIETDNKSKVVNLLETCSSQLQSLQDQMPIPEEMYDEVSYAHQAAIDRNANGFAPGASLLPDDWKKTLFDNWAGNLVGNVTGWITDKFTKWFTDTEDNARDILAGTNNEYDNANIKAGSPTPNPTNLSTQHTDKTDTGTGTGPGVGSGPGTGTGSGMPDPKLPDTKHPDTDMPNDRNKLPDHKPIGTYPDGPNSNHGGLDPYGGGGGGAGSGLAGAGGGAPTGAGVGGGGLGAGAGAGGGSPVGKPVSPDAFPGGAAGAGRGAMGRGMMGGGHGAGHGGGGDGRETWLTEDEDPWGGNDDSAPSVLGG